MFLSSPHLFLWVRWGGKRKRFILLATVHSKLATFSLVECSFLLLDENCLFMSGDEIAYLSIADCSLQMLTLWWDAWLLVLHRVWQQPPEGQPSDKGYLSLAQPLLTSTANGPPMTPCLWPLGGQYSKMTLGVSASPLSSCIAEMHLMGMQAVLPAPHVSDLPLLSCSFSITHLH